MTSHVSDVYEISPREDFLFLFSTQYNLTDLLCLPNACWLDIICKLVPTILHIHSQPKNTSDLGKTPSISFEGPGSVLFW